MLTGFLDFLANGVFNLLQGLLGLFPQMPFGVQNFEQFASDNLFLTVMGWVNYFLPIQEATTIIALWAGGMMAYIAIKVPAKYGYSILG